MGIPDHLTCLLRNLCAGQEATVRTGHGTTDRFKIGKGVHQGCIYHPAYLIYMQSNHVKCQTGWITSWNQDCWEKYQQPQTCRWYHPNGKKWRGTKEPLHEGERAEWKVGLKLNLKKIKIMAASAITSQQIDREKVEAVTDFIFLGSKITVDSDCSHEIKRCLLLGRKMMTNLDSVLKRRDITLPT